jgi:hypothetical protein
MSKKGTIISWIWDSNGPRTDNQISGEGVREVEVTIVVPSNETRNFIPRLMSWLQSDVNDERSVTLLVTGKGEKKENVFAFSNKRAAYEAGEGYRKQDPSFWYEVKNVGIWDGWEGRMPFDTDKGGKQLSLDPVKEINPKGG